MSIPVEPGSSQAIPSGRRAVLAVLLLAFLFTGLYFMSRLSLRQAAIDFYPVWTGLRTALAAPGRLYDFVYVTDLQGWPLGPSSLRPFIYPPTVLAPLAPLAAGPMWLGFGMFVAIAVPAFAWTGRRVGAPWWLAMFPVVWLTVFVGQITLLVGALVMAGLTLPKRPILSGLLLGTAAAIKPQMLVFAPLALAAEGRWRTLLSAGISGFALCLVSAAVWGLTPWLDWLDAVRRFKDQVLFPHPAFVNDMITPYALLTRQGLGATPAYLLSIPAAIMVWLVFRRSRDAADRVIALFAAALMSTPYAMQYEATLLAPAVAAYLARTSSPYWALYAIASAAFVFGMHASITPLVAAAALPLIGWFERRAAGASGAPGDREVGQLL